MSLLGCWKSSDSVPLADNDKFIASLGTSGQTPLPLQAHHRSSFWGESGQQTTQAALSRHGPRPSELVLSEMLAFRLAGSVVIMWDCVIGGVWPGKQQREPASHQLTAHRAKCCANVHDLVSSPKCRGVYSHCLRSIQDETFQQHHQHVQVGKILILTRSFVFWNVFIWHYVIWTFMSHNNRKTVLGPTYGTPIRKLALLPSHDNCEGGPYYMAYVTDDKVGERRFNTTPFVSIVYFYIYLYISIFFYCDEHIV